MRASPGTVVLCLLTVMTTLTEEQIPKQTPNAKAVKDRKAKVPLLCSTDNRVIVEKIEHDYHCGKFLRMDLNKSNIDIVQVILWHENTFNHKHKAIACRIHVTRVWRMEDFTWVEVAVSTWVLGPIGWIINWIRQKTPGRVQSRPNDDWDESLSIEACKKLNQTLYHDDYGKLTGEPGDTIKATHHRATEPSTSMGFASPTWESKDTRNAIVETGELLYDSHQRMTSVLGAMAHCENYLLGYCTLPNNKTVRWHPKLEIVEKYQLWDVKKFQQTEDILISMDHTMGLTGVNETIGYVTLNLCVDEMKIDPACPRETFDVQKSDQGVYYTIHRTLGTLADMELDRMQNSTASEDGAVLRRVRAATGLHCANDTTRTNDSGKPFKAGYDENAPDTEQALSPEAQAAGVQAAFYLHMLEAKKTLHQIGHHICATTELVSRHLLASTSGHEAATMLVRAMFRENNIMGEISGQYVSAYSCLPLHDYRIMKMNQTCSYNVPIWFSHKNGSGTGYMNSMTRIVSRVREPCDCSMALDIIVDLEGGPYVLDGPTATKHVVSPKEVHLTAKLDTSMTEIKETIVPRFAGVDFDKFLVKLTAADFDNYKKEYVEYLHKISRTSGVGEATGSEKTELSGVDKIVKTAFGGLNLNINIPNPFDFITRLFNEGLFSVVFGWIWGCFAPIFSTWQFLCCVAVTVQILTTFIIPFAVKRLFSYRGGGHVFNAGDNAAHAPALIKSLTAEVGDARRQAKRRYDKYARLPTDDELDDPDGESYYYSEDDEY